MSGLPVKLVYHEEFNDILEVIATEKQIEKGSGKKKRALIEGDPENLKKYAMLTGIGDTYPQTPEIHPVAPGRSS